MSVARTPLLDRIVQTRAGGTVERCHGLRHVGSYTTAQHQWGVAMLMQALWPADFPRLALVCLTHDVPEFLVGDIPATTKIYAPGIREATDRLERLVSEELGLPHEGDLSPDDARKLKVCDHLELFLWATEEVARGNTVMNEIVSELLQLWQDRPLPQIAGDLVGEILMSGPRSVVPSYAGKIKEYTQR